MGMETARLVLKEGGSVIIAGHQAQKTELARAARRGSKHGYRFLVDR